jgi:hypothetical protein
MTTSSGQIPDQVLEQKLPLILGISGFSRQELEAQIRAGGRFVFFEYCISFLIFTLRHSSPIFFLRAGQWVWVRGLPFSLVSLVLGWWGVPWGVVYTPLTIVANSLGGRDITSEIQARFLASGNEPGGA